MVPQHQRRLALLSKKRWKFLNAFVVKAEFQRDDVESRAVRINPQRKAIEMAPVFAVELSPNTRTAPPATAFRARDIKPGGQAHPERLAAVARPLPGERYFGNNVAGFDCFLGRPGIHDFGSAGRESGPMGRAFHGVQNLACQYFLVEPTALGGVLEAIRSRLLAGSP